MHGDINNDVGKQSYVPPIQSQQSDDFCLVYNHIEGQSIVPQSPCYGHINPCYVRPMYGYMVSKTLCYQGPSMVGPIHLSQAEITMDAVKNINLPMQKNLVQEIKETLIMNDPIQLVEVQISGLELWRE